ncbi:hypothetical protein Tsubulata_011341 [Turnera subulata]|uniref:CCHC-type domain-containing protein n=1 Tax=Turnera subulata TaxID=218843 RepID=A0A9Q0FR20_9ROSI|nr:hypothetical protein Tsubulata_011341 [Turnera subulata]
MNLTKYRYQKSWIFSTGIKFQFEDEYRYQNFLYSPSRTVVWIQIPGLPPEHYQKDILHCICNEIGRFVCIDGNTQQAKQGKFVRIAVSVDLCKPLLSQIEAVGLWFHIRYEDLPNVCFSCGRVGHIVASCPHRPSVRDTMGTGGGPLCSESHDVESPKSVPAVEQRLFGTGKELAESMVAGDEGACFGNWMIVRKRRRNPRQYQQRAVTEAMMDAAVKADIPLQPNPFDLGTAVTELTKEKGVALAGSLEGDQFTFNAPEILKDGHKVGREESTRPAGGFLVGLEPKKMLKRRTGGSSFSMKPNLKEKSPSCGEVVGLAEQSAVAGANPFRQLEELVSLADSSGVPVSKDLEMADVVPSDKSEDGQNLCQAGLVLVGDMRRPGSEECGSEGANNTLFRSAFKDLVRDQQVHLAIVVEPRISGLVANNVIRSLGLKGSYKEDARGFSGGIWLLWRDDIVQVQVLFSHLQFVHVRVSRPGSGPVVLTAVYGSTSDGLRAQLWQNHLRLSSSIVEPWAVLRDFNVLAYGHEKRGGGQPLASKCAHFWDWMGNCGLLDLGYKGPDFTWFRGDVAERLDLVLCNNAWRIRFPEGAVFHLPRRKSDHRPILLQESSMLAPPLASRPFCFQAAWMTHPQFVEFVRGSWGQHAQLCDSITSFTQAVRLAGLKRANSRSFHPWHHRLEAKLRLEFERILVREELLWMQKSRC